MNSALNHTYQLAWNPHQQAWVPVAETKTRRGKTSNGKISSKKGIIGTVAAGLTGLLLGSLSATANANTLPTNALPTNGQVTHGNATISQQGNALNIHQSSDKIIANWDSFNIGKNAQVNFIQPGSHSAALNRVLDNNPSQILGQLNANGQVFLINPNGILFGQSAQVNVGSLIASTLDISNDDFLNNRLNFQNNGLSQGQIENLGSIQANSGIIALIANRVNNQGHLINNSGDIALAAGNQVTLDFNGDGLTTVTIEQGVLDALAQNGGLIQADGGFVIMTTQARNDLYANLVNNTGKIQAQTLQNKDGKILLLGGMEQGIAQIAGTLDASAPATNNAPEANGGFIETSAAKVQIGDVQVTTLAENGQTGTWLIDPQDYTIAASGGDITGAQLSSQLQNNNITIQSIEGSQAGNGDIFVNDSIHWSANTLTLNAQRNIAINAELNLTNTAGLALEYGQAGVAAGNTADYVINAPVNIASTGSFSTKLGSDGSTITYTVVNTAADLQAMNNNRSGNYAVGSNIDLSSIDNWQPVGGNAATSFTGRFDGLGHNLSNLRINRPGTDNVGLFGYTGSTASIRNIGLVNAHITGGVYVGGLVGNNGGSINNAYATGAVEGIDQVGGLVGRNSSGSISHAYATGAVTGTGNNVGGLVGVGVINGSISHAYATGTVTGTQFVGGLVGINGGSISHAYATGLVTSPGGYVGGLVGSNNNGSISHSFWDTETTGQATRGAGNGADYDGVTGKTTTEMQQASTFATWGSDISANGGEATIWRIYEGQSGPLLRSFLTAITLTPTALTKTYNATTGGTGTYTAPAGTNASLLLGELTYTSNSKNAGNYSTAANTLTLSGLYSGQQGYDISYGDATLTINKAEISAVTGITAADRTYNGSTTATLNTSNAGFTGLVAGDALTVTGTGAFADKNAGTGKTVNITGLTLAGADAGNYTLADTTASTTASINKASISAVTGITAADRTYNGSTTATLNTSNAGFTGLVENDVLTVTGTGAFADKNAGTGKTVNISGLTLSGADAGNYTLVDTTASTTASIGQKTLIIAGVTVSDKAQDGSTLATLIQTGRLDGLVAGDDVGLLVDALEALFADAEVGHNKTVTVRGYRLGGEDAGNYVLTSAQVELLASILPTLQESGTVESGIVESTLRQLVHERVRQSGGLAQLHELSGPQQLNALLEQVLITDNRSN